MLTKILLMVISIAILTACGDQGSSRKPVVAINSPPSGYQYTPGESVTINVSAAASNMIRTLEIRSGNTLLATKTFTGTGSTLATPMTFSLVPTGEYAISAVAIDDSGNKSDAATIMIYVGSQNILSEDANVPVTTPAVTQVLADCQLAATYMADITIPDGSQLTAGSVHTKTWRVRNTSTCAWLDGYVLAFMNGELMNAPMTVPVPATALDAAVDINVPITAPSSSGIFSSTWRIRAPDGKVFGNRLYILVRVP